MIAFGAAIHLSHWASVMTTSQLVVDDSLVAEILSTHEEYTPLRPARHDSNEGAGARARLCRSAEISQGPRAGNLAESA